MNQGNRGKGRRRGVPNKFTAELREVILQALEEAGGVDYLVRVSRDNPAVFCALLGRLLPLEARLSAATPAELIVTWKEPSEIGGTRSSALVSPREPSQRSDPPACMD